MVRKLVVMLMAVLFSLSISGLGFAAEEKPAAKPAVKATQPCAAGAEKEMKPKKAQKLAEKKAACLEKATTDQAKAECEKKFAEKAKKKVAKKKAKKDEGTTMAPEKKPAPPAPPGEKK